MTTINTHMSARQRVLRPRRQNEQKEKTFVSRMVLAIEHDGHVTTHELHFNKNELPLEEMYRLGFLGDLDLVRPDGTIEEAEVEAGPAGSFDGDVVGRFAFQIRRPTGETVSDARVVKFNFEKQ